MKTLLTSISLPCLFLALSCASLSLGNPEQALRGRVEKLMQAKVEGKWDQVYELYDENFREHTPRDTFIRIPGRIDFKDYAIERIDLHPSGKSADVVVRVDFLSKGFEFKGGKSKQHWVKEWGRWHLEVVPNQTPFSPSPQKQQKSEQKQRSQ